MTPLKYYQFLRSVGYGHYTAVVSTLMNYCENREELYYHLKALKHAEVKDA